MSFYSKIVNWNHLAGTEFDASGDASLTYAKNKKLILYIGQYYSQRMLSFKGFVRDFKLIFKHEIEDQESVMIDGKQKFYSNANIEYIFVLDVPSQNPAEGRLNVGKFQELNRYLKPVKSKKYKDEGIQGDTEHMQHDNYVLVSLSNLIQNGQVMPSSNQDPLIRDQSPSPHDLSKYGAPCYLTSINMDVDTSMGFWETDEGLFPKAFSISFQLLVAPQKGYKSGAPGTGKLFAQLNKCGDFQSDDSKNWPFSVTGTGMSWKI